MAIQAIWAFCICQEVQQEQNTVQGYPKSFTQLVRNDPWTLSPSTPFLPLHPCSTCELV